MEKKLVAYKGFNKNLSCRGYQYEIGKEYEHDDNIALCASGFHACENPFDVMDYYGDIATNRYCKVEQSGQINSDGKKSVSSKITIQAEIGFIGLFKAGIEYIKEITRPEKIKSEDVTHNNSRMDYAQIGSSGDGAQIGSSGDDAQIGSSGDYAQIGSSGDYAQIDSSGNDSVICCAGCDAKVKAKVGSWITLAEWRYLMDKDRLVPICVKTEYVDGERIKADTWYALKDGKFVEIG